MSNLLLTEVVEGNVYTDYDNLAAVQFCTPTILGCNACINASVVDRYVVLGISLNTPLGLVSKSFKVTNNISFNWQPFSRFKLEVSVSNFSEAGNVFSFDAGGKVLVNIPFIGWKSIGYSHHFNIPAALAINEKDLDDNQFSTLLSLHAAVANTGECKDCKEDTKAGFLKGDIYTNYLKGQEPGFFPTIPVASCIVCIPTIVTSCASLSQHAPQATIAQQAPHPANALDAPTIFWTCRFPTEVWCGNPPLITK